MESNASDDGKQDPTGPSPSVIISKTKTFYFLQLIYHLSDFGKEGLTTGFTDLFGLE